ncbi:MAG: ABC transporter permease [Solirubrobacteraceae bacterium]
MLRLAFKGLLARKLRTVLTGFAVVLGVAFVAGTFIFTDTIDASFKDLFERTQKGVDVSVQARLAVEEEFAAPPTMPAETLARVRAVPGIEEAAGFVSADGTLLDREGEPILSQGPPTIIVTSGPERFDPFTYTDGERPDTPDEVVIDKGTADEYDFGVGDRVTVSGRAPKKDYTVSGVATLGDSENLAGSRLVSMTLPEAQRVTGHDGYDDISVAAAGGTSPEELKAAIARELGRDYAVRTGEEQAEKQAQDLSEALGFIRTALLVFAAVALLVGGFLIFNTFSVTVAQRTKEFALLRTLGASRPQILRSVLAETVVIGLIASLLGIACGLLLAPALAALMASFGLDLGSTSIVLESRTIIAGLVIGLVATVVSGFVPARRATRIEPVAAMRDSVTPGPGRLRKRRIVVAVLVEAAGVLGLLYGLLGDPGSASATATVLGLGSLLMIFGFALLAPTLVRPLSGLIGRPLARFQGLTGRLARENTRRQPQRTAVTASALMIGVALVVLVAIFAAGLRATIDQGIDEQVRAAGIVTHEDGFSPLPDGITERLADVEGVTAVSRIRFETGRLVGETGTTAVTGIDPDGIRDVLTLEWREGSDATLAGLGDGDAVVNPDFASEHDLAVGGSLRFVTKRGNEVGYRVAGIYEPGAGVIGGVLVSNASLERDWDAADIAFALVAGAPGADPGEIKRGEQAALAEFPTAKPQTIEDFKDEQNKQVDTLVGLVYALLSLSVIVALLGIVNTLALSVHERTRELGLLRAVGMSRRQVRRMVRAESVITAAIGAVLGIVLGVAFAAIVSRPLADEGFVFELPVATLIVVAVLAALAGVLAAIPPARRASRVDVLRAVTTE